MVPARSHLHHAHAAEGLEQAGLRALQRRVVPNAALRSAKHGQREDSTPASPACAAHGASAPLSEFQNCFTCPSSLLPQQNTAAPALITVCSAPHATELTFQPSRACTRAGVACSSVRAEDTAPRPICPAKLAPQV